MANFKEVEKLVYGSTPGKGYRISNKGSVFSFHSHKYLQPNEKEDGLYISLSFNGKAKPYRIALLVADHFLPPYEGEGKASLYFKDGNPFNVNYSNLQWVSSSELKELNRQQREQETNRVKRAQRLEGILNWRTQGVYMEEIAEFFGVSTSYVSSLCKKHLDRYKAKTLDGKYQIRYWFKNDPITEKHVWWDGSVPVRGAKPLDDD